VPRRYPVEFRRKVLDLIEAGRPVVEIVVYLQNFHNRQRRRSSLGMLSPIEYEIRHADNLARDQAS
jgi:hypothetical protein